MINMPTLKERLGWALQRAGMNQSELARRSKISRAAVSLWMSGTTKSIDGENLTRAARTLGVDPHWLATGEGSPDNSKESDKRKGGETPRKPHDAELFLISVDIVRKSMEDAGIPRTDKYWAEASIYSHALDLYDHLRDDDETAASLKRRSVKGKLGKIIEFPFNKRKTKS